MSANGVGLRIRLNDLIKKDQDKLGQIITLVRAQIETESRPEEVEQKLDSESNPPADDL